MRGGEVIGLLPSNLMVVKKMFPHDVPFSQFSNSQKRAKVLYLVSQKYTTRAIARELRITPRAVNRLLNRMAKDGLLTMRREVGDGCKIRPDLLTPKGENLLERYPVGCQNVPVKNVPDETIRLHNLVVACPVPQEARGLWEGRRNSLARMKLTGFKQWETPGGKFQNFYVEESVGVRTTSRTVLIRLPDFYGMTPLRVTDDALSFFHRIKPRVEKIVGFELKEKPALHYTVISSQHLAFIHDELAKFFLREKLELHIYDQRGELLWVVDESKGVPELEAIHQAKAQDIASEYKRFLHDISTKDWDTLSQLTASQKRLEAQVSELLASQTRQAQTLESAIKSIILLSQQPEKEQGWS